MKKTIKILLITILCLACLTACGSDNGDSDKDKEKSGGLKIVTTIFPIYDWTRNILGEKEKDADLSFLLDEGVDLHSYQPSAEDLAKISECDVFICVGGESDQWTEDALSQAENKDMKVIKLMDLMGDKAKEEETKEGMQEEEEEGDENSDEEGPEYDEHVWLSVKNAGFLAGKIAQQLEKTDEDNADTYKENAAAYIKKLNELDKDYQKAVASGKVKTLLFGDRFPFRYMTDDYGLDYYAAFAGCSAESEASFKTISFLAKKVDELGLKNVMTIEGSDQKIAKAIVSNTKDKNQKILSMDSMQQTTSKEVEKGSTYLDIMEKNLKTLKEALK